ncbi:protein phosphatase 1 regulatory subunit 15B [Hoplias malabaricus]|uniref:protein phosphatase 1 regulatory subunit 15B n=1 Tax=Hoplias malabaricus TaxID=27720 RepID=UPI003462CB81
MFRSMNSEKHFSSDGPQPTTTAMEGGNVARPESSWINVLSTVSRPAWSLLQKYFPGRVQTQALTPWVSDPGQTNMELGTSLHSLMPDSPRSARLKVAYVHCQHGNADTLSWLTPDSLAELGIQNAAGVDFEAQHSAPAGYLSSAKNFLSQVLLNTVTTQKDARSTERNSDIWFAEAAPTGCASSWWWDGLWGPSDGPQNEVPKTRMSTDTKWQHCGQCHSSVHCQAAECGSAVAGDVKSMLRESAGPTCFKEPIDNEGLHMLRPESLPSSEQHPSVHQHSAVGHLLNIRAVAACSEVAVLTPDQDNGYSSLEEENANTKQLTMKLADEKQEPFGASASQGNMCEETEEVEDPQCREVKSAQEGQKEEVSEPAHVDEESSFLSTPQCQNKAIAYIMGSPCSDESDLENDNDSDWDSNDDAGFDSEGSSQFSDSEDLDDSDDVDEDGEDSEADELDSESERLWNTLCQNTDPYNPRNFTATIRTAPKHSAAAATDSPLSASPAESEHSLFSSPSPLVPQEEESSEETCSMDEAENVRLWNSFSCSSDPYNPLNFQAPTRTRETARGRCKKGAPMGPPVYKKEDAEERLDSGFSETAPLQRPGSSRCVRLKKVTFVEEVEEFYASSDEDRHGPWEEFARDRCRFQRRVQEVEETISYCLSPTFRLVIFQRLYHSS